MDFERHIALVMELRNEMAPGLNNLTKQLQEMNRLLLPLNERIKVHSSNMAEVARVYSQLKNIRTINRGLANLRELMDAISAAISRLRWGPVTRSVGVFAQRLRESNEALTAHLNMLNRLAKSNIRARSNIGGDLSKAYKRETDEVTRLLNTLGVEQQRIFQESFRKSEAHLKGFTRRFQLAIELVQQAFGQMIPEGFIVRHVNNLKKFTAELDLQNKAINIGKGEYRSLGNTMEYMNTVIHELVELMLRETMGIKELTPAMQRLAHQEAKNITNQIMLNEYFHKNTAAMQGFAQAATGAALAIGRISAGGGLGAAAGGGAGIANIEQQVLLYGKLADELRQAQTYAATFMDTVANKLGVLSIMRKEIESIAKEMGVAFRPRVAFESFEKLSAVIEQSAIKLRDLRAEMEGFGAQRQIIERNVVALREMSAFGEEASEKWQQHAEKIESSLQRISKMPGFEGIAASIDIATANLSEFNTMLNRLNTASASRVADVMEQLRAELDLVADQTFELATRNIKLSESNQIVVATQAEVEQAIQTSLRGRHRMAQILEKEVAEQERLRTEYEALIQTYHRLKSASLDTSGVLSKLMGLIERRNKLISESIVKDNQFLAAESELILKYREEAQAHEMVGKAVEIEVQSRERAVRALQLQARTQERLIRAMGKQPVRFEFEKSIRDLQHILRETEAEINRVQLAKSRLAQADPRIEQFNNQLTRLKTIAASVDQEIAMLNRRLRSELPRSADAARAASRLTFTGFIEMTKSQAAWMAGFTVIFGTIYKFKEALSSGIVIMNETARVMRTMRSETLDTGEMYESVSKAIVSSLRAFGEETENISQALYELGSAGLSVEQSISALPTIMNMVVGGESDVIQTTRTVAGVFLNMTNAVIDAEGELEFVGDAVGKLGERLLEASSYGGAFVRISDIMTAAVRDHLVEIEDLNQGLKFMVAAGRQANMSFEEMVGMLSVLGDNMIRAGMAGRGLRRVISAVTKDASLFAQTFGVSFDPRKPIQFMDLMRELANRMDEGTLSAERLGDVFTRLGLRGAPIILTLIRNFDALEGTIARLENSSTGAAAEMAKIQLDKPARQVAILTENILALIREGFQPLIEFAIQIIRVINNFISVLDDFNRVLGGTPKFLFGIAVPLAVIIASFTLLRRVFRSEFIQDAVSRFRGLGDSLQYTEVNITRAERTLLNFANTTERQIKVARTLGNTQLEAALNLRLWEKAMRGGMGVQLAWLHNGQRIVGNLDRFKQYADRAGKTTAQYATQVGLANIAVSTFSTTTKAAAASTSLLATATAKLGKAWVYLRALVVANPVLAAVAAFTALYYAINKLMESTKIDIQEIQRQNQERKESIEIIREEIKALSGYAAVVGVSIAPEEKLRILRKEGLDQIKGLIIARDKEGKIILSSVDAVNALITAKKAEIALKYREDAEATRKEYNRIEKQVRKNVSAIDDYKKTLELLRPIYQELKRVEVGEIDIQQAKANIANIRTELELLAPDVGHAIRGIVRQFLERMDTDVDKTFQQIEQDIGHRISNASDFVTKHSSIMLEQINKLREYDIQGVIDLDKEVEDRMKDVEAAIKGITEAAEKADIADKLLSIREVQRLFENAALIESQFSQMSGQIGRILSEDYDKTLKKLEDHYEAVTDLDEERVKAMKSDLKLMTKDTDISLKIMTGMWSLFTSEQIKKFNEMYDDFEGTVTSLMERGLFREDAIQQARGQLLRALLEPIFEFQEKLRDVAVAFDIGRVPMLESIGKAFESGIATFEGKTLSVIRLWEEFSLQKQKAEFDAMAKRAQEFLDTFDLRFDLTNVQGIGQALDAINGQANTLVSSFHNLAEEIVNNNNKLISLRTEIERINTSILDTEADFATIDIGRIYRDALSGASNLVDVISKAVNREYEVLEVLNKEQNSRTKTYSIMEGYYNIITNLEQSLRKTQAKNISDLNSEWDSLTGGMIKAYDDVMKVEIQLRKLEGDGIYKGEQYKQLKLEQYRVTELIRRLELEQLDIAAKRGKVYDQENDNLRKQFDFLTEQVAQASVLSSAYDRIANDQGRSIEERREAAKEAQTYSRKAYETALQAADVDAKRARLAQDVGKEYFDHRKQLEFLVKTTQQDVLDILNTQKKIAEDDVTKTEELNQKTKERFDTAKKLLTDLEDKYKAIREIGNVIFLDAEKWQRMLSDVKKIVEEIRNPAEIVTDIFDVWEDKFDKATSAAKKLKEVMEDITSLAEKTGAGIAGRAAGGKVGLAGGGLVPVRVTAGEGLFSPVATSRYYTRLNQVNSGLQANLPARPVGVFKGDAGVDTIRTFVPEGSYVMSIRGMRALEGAARDIRFAATAQYPPTGYQGGGVVDATGFTTGNDGATNVPEDLGTLTIRLEDQGTVENITVFSDRDSIRRLKRTIQRDRLTKVN